MSATFPTAPRSRPLSLDDVILLNDEIQGLIAAGIPLNIGLSGFASRVPGRLREFSERLAARLAAGEPLEDALGSESASLPGEYQVVIAAGLKSGRFDEALASVARYAGGLRELRAGLRRALIYPGVVCGLAFGLLTAVFVLVVPLLMKNVDSLQLPHTRWYG
ncbi:MAG: type II secretion system F family protein [Pirellulales bacterium]